MLLPLKYFTLIFEQDFFVAVAGLEKANINKLKYKYVACLMRQYFNHILLY